MIYTNISKTFKIGNIAMSDSTLESEKRTIFLPSSIILSTREENKLNLRKKHNHRTIMRKRIELTRNRDSEYKIDISSLALEEAFVSRCKNIHFCEAFRLFVSALEKKKIDEVKFWLVWLDDQSEYIQFIDEHLGKIVAGLKEILKELLYSTDLDKATVFFIFLTFNNLKFRLDSDALFDDSLYESIRDIISRQSSDVITREVVSLLAWNYNISKSFLSRDRRILYLNIWDIFKSIQPGENPEDRDSTKSIKSQIISEEPCACNTSKSVLLFDLKTLLLKVVRDAEFNEDSDHTGIMVKFMYGKCSHYLDERNTENEFYLDFYLELIYNCLEGSLSAKNYTVALSILEESDLFDLAYSILKLNGRYSKRCHNSLFNIMVLLYNIILAVKDTDWLASFDGKYALLCRFCLLDSKMGYLHKTCFHILYNIANHAMKFIVGFKADGKRLLDEIYEQLGLKLIARDSYDLYLSLLLEAFQYSRDLRRGDILGFRLLSVVQFMLEDSPSIPDADFLTSLLLLLYNILNEPEGKGVYYDVKDLIILKSNSLDKLVDFSHVSDKLLVEGYERVIKYIEKYTSDI